MVKPPRPRRILYVQYTNPAGYPPLEHSSHILATAGWQVLFLGTGVRGAAALRFRPHKNIQVRQTGYCPAGWRQKIHYLQFCLWVLAWALWWRPNWVYASDTLATPIALILTYLPATRVLYHEHDSSVKYNSLFMRLCQSARSKLAHRAILCVIPNQQRAQNFLTEVGSDSVKVTCVWNCPALAEVIPPRAPLASDDVWLLYHGSIVPDRLPVTLLDALVKLPNRVKLRIIGYETVGHLGYIRQLQTLADQLGILARLEFVAALPRHQLLDWSQKSDIGLALMPTNSGDLNLQNMTGASNKAFDYLASGLALLVSDLPDWDDLYVRPGYGHSCNPSDPDSIAHALQCFLDHPTKMRQMGEAGRQRILTEWNYEQQFSSVCLQLENN